jgi:CRP-like cAMP-binding protein
MESPDMHAAPKLDDAPVSAAKLREAGIFGALSDDVLESFARPLSTERFAAGTVVFSEGDAAAYMYVLLEGEVEVAKTGKDGREHRVAVLGPSDGFGEMALVDMQPRSATVRTIAPARVLRISREDFARLYRQDIKSYAVVTLNIARDLSRRLRVATALMAGAGRSVPEPGGEVSA